MKRLFLLILLLAGQLQASVTLLNSFNSGEISPLLEGRVDVKKYYSGCRTLENMVVLPHGGVVKRPGSQYIASAKIATQTCRLIPFEFSTEQAYILELGNEYMRFYKDGGQITKPYGTEDLSGIGDVKMQSPTNRIMGNTLSDSRPNRTCKVVVFLAI